MVIIALGVVLASCSWCEQCDDSRVVIDVHCDEGESLTDAVSKAQPGQIFVVTGTCKAKAGAPVHISQEGITIIGGEIVGGDDKPAIVITGKNATIKDSTVRDSLYGISVVGDGSARLENVSAVNNRRSGLCIKGEGSPPIKQSRDTERATQKGRDIIDTSPSFLTSCGTKGSGDGTPKRISHKKPLSILFDPHQSVLKI